MDNYFITRQPYTKLSSGKLMLSFSKLVNKGLRKLRLGYTLTPIDTRVDMNTVEQRINYYHLLNQVIQAQIEGDVVELGCFTGQCALLFEKVIQQNNSPKQLHLYDSFEISFSETKSIEDVLKASFESAGLKIPHIHKGYFNETLSAQLPEKIAFAHIDCGHGGDKHHHKQIMLYCMEEIYPKMSKGAICVLMDYNDVLINGPGHDANPGVKLACDIFFKDKAEQVIPLYGNQYFHAYFRKT